MDQIFLPDKTPIPQLEPNARLFLDKMTVLYGETNTGKSKIILWLCNMLKDYFPVTILVNPTINNNPKYSSIFPGGLIYKTVSEETLKAIYQRQDRVTELYNLANSIGILAKIFNRIADAGAYSRLAFLEEKTKACIVALGEIKDIAERGVKKEQAEKNHEMHIRKLYKTYIETNKQRLLQMNITEEERTAIKCLHINPRVLIILDDCGAEADKWKKMEVISQIAFQGRQVYITCIIAMQNDKGVPPHFRKNSMNSVFTTSTALASFIECKTNGMPKQMIKMAQAIGNVIFSDAHARTFKKIIYTREDPIQPFKWLYANAPEQFVMCGRRIREMLQHAQKDDNKRNDSNNEYINRIL